MAGHSDKSVPEKRLASGIFDGSALFRTDNRQAPYRSATTKQPISGHPQKPGFPAPDFQPLGNAHPSTEEFLLTTDN